MQWFFFIVLSALCVLIVADNDATVVRAWFRKKGGSLVPLIGGLSGMLALLISPLPGWRDWWWVPLVADVGTAWLLAACLIAVCVWTVRRSKVK